MNIIIHEEPIKDNNKIGKPNPVQKAYDILVDCRDNDNSFDIDTVIGYLSEALED